MRMIFNVNVTASFKRSLVSLLLVVLLFICSVPTDAFQAVSPLSVSTTSSNHRVGTNSKLYNKPQFNLQFQLLLQANDDNDTLRNEIEQMKKEALQKLNNLEVDVDTATTLVATSTGASTNTELPSNDVIGVSTSTSNRNNDNDNDNDNIDNKEDGDDTFVEKIAVSNKVTATTTTTPSATSLRKPIPSSRDVISLLDDTTWKVSFNIGREPGTWMPKDWGISGERLVMNLDMTFTDRQLYEREEFLGSMGGAKILHIKNNELTLAPTLTQGTRQIKVLDGGWRVAQGAGPMDTDLLRFYFEIEEQISRDGDVYCPKGRIYANCGYFPTNRQSSGFKERLKNDLDRMIAKAEALDDVIAAEGAFSLNKIKKQAELFRLKVDMQATGEKLMAASIAEPNDSLLKMSQDRSVGLTREGGICCKVPKGIAIEYHILGRFNIASMQLRDDL